MKEKIAIVVSKFNEEITMKMKNNAIQRAKELKVDIVRIVEVPGAFEIPFAVGELLESKKIQAVATLGTIIKGNTNHDEVIAHAIAKKLLDLSIEYKKPVSLGISGPNITWEQSKKKIEEYSTRAVDSVVEMLRKY